MSKFVVGLTGGIASGKSAVSEIFSNLGAYIIDADLISREIMQPGTQAVLQIAEAFPGTVIDGALDRKKLREVAFANKQSTERLNSITHPAIIGEMRRRIELQESGMIVLDVPLLFETECDSLCNVTVTVSCNENVRIERLMKRDNIDRALSEKIIARQMSDAERERRADIVIDNNSTREQLAENVKRLYIGLMERFNN